MGDEIRIPQVVTSFFFSFFRSLFKVILKTAELPALCINVVFSTCITYLFLIYLQYRINKQQKMSFEFSSILLTVDRLKH